MSESLRHSPDNFTCFQLDSVTNLKFIFVQSGLCLVIEGMHTEKVVFSYIELFARPAGFYYQDIFGQARIQTKHTG